MDALLPRAPHREARSRGLRGVAIVLCTHVRCETGLFYNLNAAFCCKGSQKLVQCRRSLVAVSGTSSVHASLGSLAMARYR